MTRPIVKTHWVNVDRLCADRACDLDNLSSQERERASQYHHARDRRRYAVRTAYLRKLLGSYLRAHPADVSFVYNEYGKPALPNSNLRFNLSHSHGITLFALARGAEVGCDVEKRDPEFAAEQIPERFFSPREVDELRSLQSEIQTEAFFDCWTRKEAFVKALGDGLSRPLDSFDVSLTPGHPANLLRGGEGWSLAAIDIAPDYSAAVVVQD